ILDLNERIDEARERNTVLLNKSRELVSETLRIINRLGSPETKGSGYTRGAEPVDAASKQPRVSLALDRRV
ncbi:MAG TPA: hypothetical protein VLB27_06550, partial [candidate division Zixibacteria bacterium]|nr:hypothetical protein [candidate division Zixibacteria bacterium]